MKYLKKYKIPFSGLSTGKHNFEFDIDDAFFACFEHSLVKKGNLTALVELQKQENMLIANFNIKGHIELHCDVCLRTFDAPLATKERVIVKFTHDEWDQESDEIIVLSHNDYEFDISNLLYEYINVCVPHYPKCSEQGENIDCDPAMLEQIADENDVENESKEDQLDPRWEALKKIKNN
ncbi:YceD family protein [Sphingobacterium corticis]|uniref:YceD family protein n=1 Tax=Sphingobacterium corticis TaxID=1812823 RepID=A0ABW5NFQ5_9SPHI